MSCGKSIFTSVVDFSYQEPHTRKGQLVHKILDLDTNVYLTIFLVSDYNFFEMFILVFLRNFELKETLDNLRTSLDSFFL